MPETRRPSTRLKSERYSKRKSSTPPAVPSTKARKRSLPPEKEPKEASLPTSLKDGQPLPTIKNLQPSSLSESDYKSVAESGVLSMALEKSRQKWLTEGLFDRYWVKPTKKNPQDSNNPAKDTMHKMGQCTMIIEPHQFEVTLYSVKSSPQQVTFLPPQKPVYPSTGSLSYGSPYGTSYQQQGPSSSTQPLGSSSTGFSNNPPYSQGVPSPSVQKAPQAPTHASSLAQPAPPPNHAGLAPSSGSASTSTLINQAPASPTMGTSTGPSPTPSQDELSHNGQKPSPDNSQTPTQVKKGDGQLPATSTGASGNNNTNQEAPGTDPVIQMLAARAAEDPNLKALMKVVAQGHANQEQLSIFQRHIDELNAIIDGRKRQLANAGTPIQRPNASVSSTSPTPRPSVPAPVMTPIPPPRPLHPAIPPTKQEHSVPYYSPHQVIKAKGAVPPKQEISAVVFEFAGAPQTRYLIPKNSIVEHISSKDMPQVLCSFIIVRKGSIEFGGKYEADKEYYQPVTMKLRSNMPKFVESVMKAVAPPEEVRRQMTEIMENTDIAESVYLATRLPRVEGEDSKGRDTRIAGASGDGDIPQEHYDGPNSIIPLRPGTCHLERAAS